ncbi:unnamed protein product [Gordionus sp. m RMFG-2023]|uniref:ralBP1-associated Eps domain-containing protein 1-like n=1 Tax=Gordionus sp. m RMFG-2023 TaxID=3053472 RepID=UPI0030E59DCA
MNFKDNHNFNVWNVKEEHIKFYIKQFKSLQPNIKKLIAGGCAKSFFKKSGLSTAELSKIWSLADITKDCALSINEFIIAMHLIIICKNGINLPNKLPSNLELDLISFKTAELLSIIDTDPNNSYDHPKSNVLAKPAVNNSSAAVKRSQTLPSSVLLEKLSLNAGRQRAHKNTTRDIAHTTLKNKATNGTRQTSRHDFAHHINNGAPITTDISRDDTNVAYTANGKPTHKHHCKSSYSARHGSATNFSCFVPTTLPADDGEIITPNYDHPESHSHTFDTHKIEDNDMNVSSEHLDAIEEQEPLVSGMSDDDDIESDTDISFDNPNVQTESPTSIVVTSDDLHNNQTLINSLPPPFPPPRTKHGRSASLDLNKLFANIKEETKGFNLFKPPAIPPRMSPNAQLKKKVDFNIHPPLINKRQNVKHKNINDDKSTLNNSNDVDHNNNNYDTITTTGQLKDIFAPGLRGISNNVNADRNQCHNQYQKKINQKTYSLDRNCPINLAIFEHEESEKTNDSCHNHLPLQNNDVSQDLKCSAETIDALLHYKKQNEMLIQQNSGLYEENKLLKEKVERLKKVMNTINIL